MISQVMRDHFSPFTRSHNEDPPKTLFLNKASNAKASQTEENNIQEPGKKGHGPGEFKFKPVIDTAQKANCYYDQRTKSRRFNYVKEIVDIKSQFLLLAVESKDAQGGEPQNSDQSPKADIGSEILRSQLSPEID